MLIYTALEHYPSLYKPYFDTQFVDFVQAGHELHIFSVERQGGDLSDKVNAWGLDKLTSGYPATLKHIPRNLTEILANFLRNPFRRAAKLVSITDAGLGLKLNLINYCRMMLLPLKAPDIFLVHNLTTATQLAFLKRLYGDTPVIMYYHGGEISGVPRLDQQAAKKAFENVDVVFTNTMNSRQHAIERGAPADRIRINPVGFDIEEFHPLENRQYRKDGILRLISIGRISWEKGFIYALQAIEQLVKDGYTSIHYTLVGDGMELENLKRYVAEHGLENHVDFPGHEGSRERLYQKISAADALILPSIATDAWEETQGCVLQEAMLLETLVITSTTGGIPESIATEMSAFSFPPEDPGAIAAVIGRLIDMTDEEFVRLGRHCRDYTRNKYAIRPLNERLLEVVAEQKGI